MPRNSTGNYTLPLPPVVSGELIEAAWANTTLDDIGQALTDSLDRYGRGGMLAAFLFADGTVSNPGAAWANAPGTGFFRDSTHLGFSWNGAEVVSYNANGMAGKIDSMRVTGMLNIDKTGSFSFDADNEAPMWYLGRASGDRFTLFNAISGIESISVDPTSGDITFGKNARLPSGDLQFPGGSGVSFYQPDGTTEQWKLAGGLFSGDGDFGIYNVVAANWALLINTTDNQLTFGGTTKYPNNTAMRMIDSNGVDRWLLGKGGGTDNRFVLYNLVAGLDAFAFNPDNNNGTFGGTLYANALFSGMEGSGLEKYIGFSGNQGIAGPYLFFSGNAVFVGLYWDPVGTIWIYDRSTGNLNLPAPGSIRGKSFVATPNPS